LMGDGSPKIIMEQNVTLSDGPGAIEWLDLGSVPNPNTTALVSTIQDEGATVVSEHVVTLTLPKNLRVSRAQVSFQIAPEANADGTIDIKVTSNRVALWVTLTSSAQGHFSDNAFFLPATTKTIHFIPFLNPHSKEHRLLLEGTLRVEDFSKYGKNEELEASIA
jgi:beta-mannosidase